MAGEGRTRAPWEPRPQCETARHRLFCGRMGTALHLLCRFDRGFGGRELPSRSASTGGLRASSSVASALLPGASRQRTYPVAGYLLVKVIHRA